MIIRDIATKRDDPLLFVIDRKMTQLKTSSPAHAYAAAMRERLSLPNEDQDTQRLIEQLQDIIPILLKEMEHPTDFTKDLLHIAELHLSGVEAKIMAQDQLLTTTEAAKLLGISRPMLTDLIKRGRIEAIMVGTHHKLKAQEIQSFKQRRRQLNTQGMERLSQLGDEFGDLDY